MRSTRHGIGLLAGSDEEAPLVCDDVLTLVKLQDALATPYRKTDRLDPKARFFPKFSQRRLFKGLPFVNGAARRRPKVLSGERSFFIDKTEQ